MREAWKKYLDVELNDYLSSENLARLSIKLGYKPGQGDEYEDLFYRIFLNKIEPLLGIDAPVFVYDYPAQMCSLSQISKTDPRYAERVELYVGGLELANGFGELTDAKQQKELLQRDLELRKKLGKQTWPIDEDFIAALESGVPNAGGVALGVDRMVLLFTGAKDLNEVIFQSVADQLSFW
jgi:lysyl-tRNA synthetase class 2